VKGGSGAVVSSYDLQVQTGLAKSSGEATVGARSW